MDTNSLLHREAEIARQIRGTTRDNIVENTNVANPITKQNLFAELYEAAMALADTTMTLPLAAAAPEAAVAAGAVNAAGNIAEDTVQRGGTSGQALTNAGYSAAIDAALGSSVVKNVGDTVGGTISGPAALAKSVMLAEGEQAAGSTVQEAVDNMVMGDKSLYEMRIREMMKTTGMSRGEAERTALTQDVRSLGSTTPLVSGLGLHGGSWGLRRLFGSGSMQNARRNAGAQANPYNLAGGMSEQDIVAELWARGIIKDLPEKEVKSNQPYTDNDMKIIKWLHGYEDAFGDPPFTEQGNGGIMNNNKLPWDSWQNYQKVEANGQQYAKVGDRLYSKHAVDRMQPSGRRYKTGDVVIQFGGVDGRSVAPQFVEDIIKTTEPKYQPKTGNYEYISGTIKIITNPQGYVVTIMTYMK